MWVRFFKVLQSRWQLSGVMESFLEEREEKSILGVGDILCENREAGKGFGGQRGGWALGLGVRIVYIFRVFRMYRVLW